MSHTHTPDPVIHILEHDTNISIIHLLDTLIEHAQHLRASDIHIHPEIDHLSVRLRIDGMLHHSYTFPKHIHHEFIARIKVLARLRSDEHQATQDGRFRYTFSALSHHNRVSNFLDIRVSIAPTYHGENAVLRLLSEETSVHTLIDMGFSHSDSHKIEQAIKKQSGMILATGPTGSGKTSTLYTLIKNLHSNDISIISIEDPIEYAITGITQIQVNPRTGLSFSTGLRSILRQDPNVIMVGEIRDSETAHIAVNCALTGHLLLSTLHTNDAATTLPRLLDMGVEEYLLASTIRIAIGQRLVRTICPGCKESYTLSHTAEETLAHSILGSYFSHTKTLHRGRGCAACGHTGFSGRTSINEVLVAEDNIREAILRKTSARELRTIAITNGMTTMMDDGVEKIKHGLTTIEEVIRVMHD